MANEETQQTEAEEKIGEETETAQETEQESTTVEDTESPDYRAKLNAQNRFLEKEGYEFKEGKWQKKPAPAPTQTAAPSTELTTADALAIVRAGVSEEDEQRVISWAKGNGQSIAEALKDKDLQLILNTRAEERKTAAATNTGSGRGTTKVNGADLLAKALRTGEVPETDEGMAALAEARFASKRPPKR